MSDFFKSKGTSSLSKSLSQSSKEILQGATEKKAPEGDILKKHTSKKISQTPIWLTERHKGILKSFRQEVLKHLKVPGADFRNTNSAALRILIEVLDLVQWDRNQFRECDTEKDVANLIYEMTRK